MAELEKAHNELIKAQKWLQTVEAGMKLKMDQLKKAREDYMKASTEYVKLKNAEPKKDDDVHD